jgi:hypothetical protein
MFDNLLYIFSKDTNDDASIENNYYIREVNKLNKMLLQKNSELQLLQRKYNKLLNHCIENELASKLNNKKRIESIIIKDIQDSHDSHDVLNTPEAKEDAIYIRENNRDARDARDTRYVRDTRDVSDNDEYEKI